MTKMGCFILSLSLFKALVAQSVEHVLGKDGVGGSNPLEGSRQTQEGGERWRKRNLKGQSHM